MPSPPCWRRPRRRSRPGATRRRSATPAGRSTSTRPTPRPSAACCWCARRPSSSGATSPRRRPTPTRCWPGPSPTATARRRPRPAAGSGSVAQVQGDLSTARRELGDGRSSCSATLDDARRLADALRARGFAEVFGGSLEDARTFLGEAMEIYHQIDDERGHAWTHQNLAWVAFQAGDFDDAEVQLIEAKERFEELGDSNGVSWADGLRAYVLYFQRRFDEAEQLAVAVEVEARRRADSWAGLMMQTLLANLRLWTGRLADAEQFAERALNGFRDINDRYGVMQALGPLNRARAGLGKKADAKRGVEEAISLGKAFGELGHGAPGRRRRGDAPRGRRAGAAPRRAGHRAQPGDRDDAARGARAAGARQPAGRRHRPGRGGDRAGRRRRLPVRARRPGARRAPSPATRTTALADAEGVEATRGASYFDLSIGRLAGVLACERAGDPAGSERLAGALEHAGVLGRRRRVHHHRPGPPRPPADPTPTAPSRRRWPPAGAASSTPSSSARVNGLARSTPRSECLPLTEGLPRGLPARSTRSGAAASGASAPSPRSVLGRDQGDRRRHAGARPRLRLPAGARRRAGRRRRAWCCCSTTAGSAAATSGCRSSSRCPATSSRRSRLGEHERTGRLDVGAFYGRRLRRLLPASLACLAGDRRARRGRAVRRRRRPAAGHLGRAGPGLQLGRPVGRADATPTSSPPATGRRRRSSTTGRWRSRSSSTGCGRSSSSSSCAPGGAGRLLAVGAMTAARGRRRPADRRRVGTRRGVLGDAGPPRRDPRRGAAGRRPARSPSRRHLPPAAAVAGRRRPRRHRLGGRHVAERIRPGLRGLAAGVRPGIGGGDRRPAGAVTAASSARRRAARRPRRDQLRRVPLPLAGLRRARRRADRTARAAAVRPADHRHARASPWCRTGLLERPIRTRRLRWRPGIPTALAACASIAIVAAVVPVDSTPYWMAGDARGDRGDAGAGRLGRRAACRRAAPTTVPTTATARRPHAGADTTSAAAPTTTARRRPRRRPPTVPPVPAVPPAAADRAVAPGADHGRRRLDRLGDRRRDAGVGRRSRRHRPRRRAGGARLRVHPRRRRSRPTRDDGFRRDVHGCSGPSGSRQPCRHCTPTSSSGW